MAYNGRRTSHYASRLAAAADLDAAAIIYEEAIREDAARRYALIEWRRLNKIILDRWDEEKSRKPLNDVKEAAWKSIRASANPVLSVFDAAVPPEKPR